jgi:uncharacterized protein (TIGR02246 family)
MRIRFLAVLVAVSGLACGEAPPPLDADVAAIQTLIDRTADANNAGDIMGWVELFTDDAVYMPANGPAVTTRDGLESIAVSGFSRYRSNIEITPVEIEVFGDWAFARTAVTGSVVPRGDGNPIRIDMKQIALYRRQSNGRWKLARLIGNSNLPQ